MARISLTAGSYKTRSLIASAQRCVNLYVEPMPDGQGEPSKATHYPTPGLTALVVGPSPGPVRGIWAANNGMVFVVINTTLYQLSSAFALTALGTIPGVNPVSMSDNSLVLVVVNGQSLGGWTVTFSTMVFALIVDPAFYGADKVDYIDTFFVFNKTNTQQFYLSNSLATTFNPLYFASKVGAADNLQTVAVARREMWLVGSATSEVYFNSGAADFPFQVIPGAFIEEGTVALYSVARIGLTIFWLSRNRIGQCYIVKGENYAAVRVSTYAIENAIAGYAVVSDAIGFTYQQGGHGFYVLTFPTQDATWVYDTSSGAWHERTWTDSNGLPHRHRAMCCTLAFGKILVGDWQNGTVYALDQNAYTDAGQPIQRIRSFPHMMEDADRVLYRQFIADMEVGTITDDTEPVASLRWSDNRGASWGNPVALSFGKKGDFLLSMQAQRLGIARDRVFELSWSAPIQTALNGAFIDVAKVAS